MVGLTAPELPNYVPPPPTKADLDYIDLPVIDLAVYRSADRPGILTLAQQARDAMKTHGFLYVINHGYTTEQTERIFDIADIPFSQVGDDEKRAYAGRVEETGSFQGYKPRQYWHIDGGVRDQIEHYVINRDVTKRQHPEALRRFLPEIEGFARHSHEEVLHPILRLLALGMELPEETFVNMHGFSSVGETYGGPVHEVVSRRGGALSRFIFVNCVGQAKEEEVKTKNVWLKGHTDTGSITILYSQPVSALQILTKDSTWKWVRHIENSLIINVGDALAFLSGGFYRATIHRVVQPPLDQQNHARLGVFYFCMTDDNVKLAPLLESPVLRRDGISVNFDGAEPPTMEAWRKARSAAYGRTDLKPKEKGVEEEIINGVVVKHYN